MVTRRDFLKLTGVAAVGVATGAVAELMKDRPWLERLDLVMDRELWDKNMYRWRLIYFDPGDGTSATLYQVHSRP